MLAASAGALLVGPHSTLGVLQSGSALQQQHHAVRLGGLQRHLPLQAAQHLHHLQHRSPRISGTHPLLQHLIHWPEHLSC
jgi:hypothetical protein